MGNKGSKNGLSKETIDFLVKNTKFSREMIKVFKYIFTKTKSSFMIILQNRNGTLVSK